MNPNYVVKVREDLDKLLDARFIYPIESTKWLSPLIIIPKKMGSSKFVWIIGSSMHPKKNSIWVHSQYKELGVHP
jgi:hypothetical protein